MFLRRNYSTNIDQRWSRCSATIQYNKVYYRSECGAENTNSRDFDKTTIFVLRTIHGTAKKLVKEVFTERTVVTLSYKTLSRATDNIVNCGDWKNFKQPGA